MPKILSTNRERERERVKLTSKHQGKPLKFLVNVFLCVGAILLGFGLSPKSAFADIVTMPIAVKADTDHNGAIDRVTIVFSQSVDINDILADGFDSLTLTNSCTIANGDYSNNDQATLTLILSGCVGGTGITPTITYHKNPLNHSHIYANSDGDEIANGEFVVVLALGIGDSYQGGIVAYILQPGDPGYTAEQTKGLIAAASDQSTVAEWGCIGTTISGADGTAIGTGNQNTIDIMAGCGTAGIAARLAGDLVEGGYSDWYLPSKDELDKLYINMDAIGASGQYWSSSEDNASVDLAWDQDLSLDGGGQFDDNKDNSLSVRAVRSFIVTPPSIPGIPQATVGTNLTSQVWTWTASTDTGSGVKQYDWRVDGGPSGTSTSPTVTTNLTEGNWKFYVKSEDNAGNQSAESSSLLAVMVSSVHEIVIDCAVPLIQITVADSVPNPYLDLSPITASNGELLVANISCEIRLKTILPSATVTVNIPAGATIKGSATLWPKIIVPPTTTTTTTLPANSQVALAVIIGHAVAPLEITRGVRIFMEGQAGKKIGYISNSVFTEIASTCTDDSQTTGDTLSAEGNCKIDSGSDLVIWTKHFSEFITYTIAAVSQNPPSGGGSIPAEWYNPPKSPAGGFGVSINSGAEYTASPTTILSLKGGSDTAKMVISNSPDFKDAGQENYATTKIWNLCWKNAILQTPSDCPAGTYTVYAKYYTSWGTASNVVSDAIVIKKLDQIGQNPVLNSVNQPFTKNLKLGQTSADVKRLQIFLNQNFDTQIAKSGVGSPGKETTFFGSLTKTAVIKFQEKYASEILTPLSFKKGTGICAEYTRAKINKLLGF